MMDDVRTETASPVEHAEQPVASQGGSKNTRRTQPIDIAIGARIRALRIAAKMSQGALGQAVGVKFQQIQKYETGQDRVAVGTLKAIADAFNVHPGTFFESDVSVPTGSNADARAALKAVVVLQRVRDPRVLKQLLALAELLGADVGGEAG